MWNNVLDAIREGDWYFEPQEVEAGRFAATSARPGTDEKIAVLAERVRAGLPLWHRADGADVDES